MFGQIRDSKSGLQPFLKAIRGMGITCLDHGDLSAVYRNDYMLHYFAGKALLKDLLTEKENGTRCELECVCVAGEVERGA